MRKIINKKVLPYALVGTMLLSGCGKQEEKAMPEVTTIATTEATTELTTEEAVLEIVTEEQVNNYVDSANSDYMANQQFYDYATIDAKEIEDYIKVINSDVSTLTKKEVTDACDNIDYIMSPQYLIDALGAIHDAELGYVIIDGNFSLLEVPSLSKYATDEETKEYVEQYETLRNQVITDINTTNAVSEETKQALKDAVVEMEKDYIVSDTDMNGDVSEEGQKLLENYAKKNLVDLTAYATSEQRIYSESFPSGLKIAAETDEERDVRAKAMINGLDALTDSEKEIYNNLTLELVAPKYIDGICTNQEELKENAIDIDDTHSKIDELKQYKEYLISMQEAKQYTLSM